MDVGTEAEGLRVADLALFSTSTPSVYQFSVLITQVAEKRRYVGGEVIVKVIGLMGEQRETVTFSQDNAVVGFPLKFGLDTFKTWLDNLNFPKGSDLSVCLWMYNKKVRRRSAQILNG